MYSLQEYEGILNLTKNDTSEYYFYDSEVGKNSSWRSEVEVKTHKFVFNWMSYINMYGTMLDFQVIFQEKEQFLILKTFWVWKFGIKK